MMKYLKVTIFFIQFIISNHLLWAQAGHHIEGQIKGMNAKPYLLAHYFGSSQYIIKDTAKLIAPDKLLFEGKTPLTEGLYMLLTPSKKRIADFVIGADQHFSFATDSAYVIDNMNIMDSNDNTIFYKYQQRIRQFSKVATALQSQNIVKDIEAQKVAEAKLTILKQEMDKDLERILTDGKATFTTKLIKASKNIDLPPSIKDSTALYNYYVNHYWDNIDFSDERLVRTPFLQNKLDYYYEQLVFQHPDTLIKACDEVIQKAIQGNNKEVKAYFIWYLTNKAESSKLLGSETVFVHLAEKYYLGRIMPILDPSVISNVQDKVNTLKPLLIGKTMPNFVFKDTASIDRPLTDIASKYTILFFYDPDCRHCIESIPALKTFADKRKEDVKIYAISVSGDTNLWKNFINTHQVGNWIHGYDFSYRIDFRKQFDVMKTPMIYILDQHKKIIGRRLDSYQLESFINFYESEMKVVK